MESKQSKERIIGYKPLVLLDAGLGCIIPIILCVPRTDSTIAIYLGSNIFKGKLPWGNIITPGRGNIGSALGKSLKLMFLFI